MTCTRSTTRTSRVVQALALGLLLQGPALPAAAAADARTAVEATIAKALEALRDDSLTSDARRTRIEDIAYDSFDFDRMSRLVLARGWKKLSEGQRAEFEVEFRRHLGITYGGSLEKYANEDIVVGDERRHKNGDVSIQSTVVGGSNDGVRIDYRMRERDGRWLAIDVIVERVSLVANFRSQVQDILRSHGPDELIRILHEKNEERSAKAL